MPIYEYRCESCGHDMEVLQKMSDEPLTVCPECGRPALKKLISAGGFILKGTGWYETDFKGGNKQASDKKEAEKTPDKGAKQAAKKTGGDSKPVTKT
jgi:putative FmdB family regulatory protein